MKLIRTIPRALLLFGLTLTFGILISQHLLDSLLYPRDSYRWLEKLNKTPAIVELRDFLAPIEQCLIRKAFAKGSLWDQFHWAVGKCIDQTTLRAKGLDVRNLDNLDETKGFIPVKQDLVSSTDCTIVSLGIGNDTVAEWKMKQLVPHSRFYGADPILESGIIYESIGTYDQVAVATEDGWGRASVLANGTYKWQNMKTVSLVNYLQGHKITLVDDMLIDNEGPEYQLMPYLARDGPLSWAGITICQLNIEVHKMPIDYGFPNEKYDELMVNFWTKSPFWPILSAQSSHNRYYFVNFEDPECVRRFFGHY